MGVKKLSYAHKSRGETTEKKKEKKKLLLFLYTKISYSNNVYIYFRLPRFKKGKLYKSNLPKILVIFFLNLHNMKYGCTLS